MTSERKRTKLDALIEEGTLNPQPEKVSDPKFKPGDFFDPRDAVQVKYELLRRVLVDALQGSKDSGRPVHYLAWFDKMLCCHDSPLREVLIESAGLVVASPVRLQVQPRRLSEC